jgi:methylmalonyl-CoA epimerase
MKAILDHVGIAVADLAAALAFYRDALGLEIEPPEEVTSQRVRAHFVPVGDTKLELLEATSPDSPIAKYVGKRGPGLHHITLRVDDIHAAIAQLKARGARLVDEQPRAGAEGALIAFIHPAATHGVLVELKQSSAIAHPSSAGQQSAAPPPPLVADPSSYGGPVRGAAGAKAGSPRPPSVSHVQRFSLGDLELVSLCDGFFHVDGGAMFGSVPKPLWEKAAPSDAHNRIRLALRPLIVRGARTMIIDAGIGDKESAALQESDGLDRARTLDHTLAEAGIAPGEIDIVLATHLHFDHAGGFTVRDAGGRVRPRFPRAQYIVRRGEWDDAMRPHATSRVAYRADNYVPLAEAGVLQLVDDDVSIMPGVRVRRTGGHTRHHQIVLLESGGRTAAFVADLMPTAAHVPDSWIAACDLYPMDTLAAKTQFAKEAAEKNVLVFFEHDPATAAGYISQHDGRPSVIPAPG